jgi:hypothetical protein
MAIVVAAVIKIGKRLLKMWLISMLALYFLLPAAVYTKERLFFTKAAFLTFGEAYTVLAYIAQVGVEHFGALSAITAAVVGVILNLAVWFGLHVLFPADAGGL